ncbi:hypothetical protein [Streptomyces sp. Isolate_219]|uniref:hypothetical protein n=1 Tax=Streptomyces sp. Isolate_219 TaxID=2950110 RepID=UPI0021C6F4CF|nr:hypothetical protein [Streptomyces sp. Isolate_219]MCR8576453.1 hypothetical protein [Streptomyces sp. Isolate_219]
MGKVRTRKIHQVRHYFDTEATEIVYPGVTSICGMIAKPFLAPWSAGMTADLALDSLEFIKDMADRDRKGARAYLAGAARRYTDIRSDIGTRAHTQFELMARGLPLDDDGYHPDMVPYVAHYREFLQQVNPEFVRHEDIAWSDTHEYAGSFDAYAYVWFVPGTDTPDPTRKGEKRLVIIDYKTSKSAYPDVALQLSAYAHADFVIDTEGVRHPMPTFDGGAVLWITPDKWEFKPVRIDYVVFSHFLHLRETFRWDREVSGRVLERPIAGSAAKFVSGSERRAK